MKLLLAIINKRDARGVREALIDSGFRFTELASSGGFLGADNATILIGAPDEHVERVVTLLREYCHAREETVSMASADTRMFAPPVGETMTVSVGGAHVFVLDVERALTI